jgi:hypothetical protein
VEVEGIHKAFLFRLGKIVVARHQPDMPQVLAFGLQYEITPDRSDVLAIGAVEQQGQVEITRKSYGIGTQSFCFDIDDLGRCALSESQDHHDHEDHPLHTCKIGK